MSIIPGRIYVTMLECSDSIGLVKLPPTQHGAGDDAAGRDRRDDVGVGRE